MEETRQLGRNDKSLQQIARTIQLSEGQFALIPARCNYRGLQARLLRRLEDLVSGDIREIRLPEQTRALYSFLQAQSEQDAAPQALFVSGLETLKALPEVLKGANQMREEFSKGFAFPLILWVTDWTLEQFSRQAPDLKNWAGAPVSFELPAGDAQETLRRNTQNALDEAESSEEPLLCDLSRPREFEAFREEQESRIAEWPPELQADWRIFLAIHEKDRAKALDAYRQSLSFWEERGERRRQGFLLNRIGEVYERAEEWHKLETLAERALELNEQCGNERQIAESRRLTAGLALSRKAWQRAADSARKALENTSNPEVRLRTRLMLAQALQGLQQTQEALTLLEEGAEERPEKYAPQPAIRRLELLYDLYRSQKKYLQAFYAKQERLSLEQQFGLRAFIGAGRLKARQTPGADADRAVSLEIQASGRQLTLNHLFGRLETKKLLVLHGESGVGKSSLLEAGLLPLLENTSLGGREALPLLIRNYENWGTALAEQIPPFPKGGPGGIFPQSILTALRWNGEHNRTTVLIFDQFEEFFFAYPRQEERRAFYAFLQCCLDDKQLPFVRVILSLREDYLHYLLECVRFAELAAIENDVLAKKNRVEIGNLSRDEAASLIRRLCDRSQFSPAEDLIDRLVNDLAQEGQGIRPIELQLVGAQLQEEGIQDDESYSSIATLVRHFMEQAVLDCGPEYEEQVWVLLYALTDERRTRPVRSRAELLESLQEAEFRIEASLLDTLLEILSGTGLIFLIPGEQEERCQLVHDYLADLVRQGKAPQILADAKERKIQRRAEQKQARQREEEQRRRQRNLLKIAVVLITIFGGLAAAAGWFGFEARRQEKLLNEQLEVSESLRQEADQSRVEAEASTEKALQQRGLTLEAISILTYRTFQELSQLPRAKNLLREILSRNTLLLDKIAALDQHDATVQREKAANLSFMGDMWLVLGNTQEALSAHQQSSEIFKALADADPANAQAQRDLSVSYNKLGDVQLQLGNTQEALSAYQQSLEIAKALADADPANAQAQRDLSISYIKLGDVQRQLGNTQEALKTYQQKLEIDKALTESDPANVQTQRNLSISYERLGDVQLQLRSTQEAVSAYQQSLEIRQALADADPANAQAQRDLSVSYNKFGELQLQLGNTQEALSAFQQAQEIAKALADADPANAQAQRDLAVSYEKIGDVQRDNDNAEAALTSYKQSLSITKRLADADPSSAAAQRTVMVSYVKLGSSHENLNEKDEALDYYRKTLALAEVLAQDELNQQAQDDLRIIRNAVERLGG